MGEVISFKRGNIYRQRRSHLARMVAEFIFFEIPDFERFVRIIGVIVALIKERNFPDVSLHKSQRIRLRRALAGLRDLDTAQRHNALWLSQMHMRRHMLHNPFLATPIKNHLRAFPIDRDELHLAYGVLSLAWQIKKGGELVTTYQAFDVAHPDVRP